MQPFKTHFGRVAALPRANVDTDQIIPKQFLKRIERTGFGSSLFFDWRYRADGSPNPDFELNRPAAAGASVLVTGPNFGCGSSREHAPQALYRWGIRALIAESYAEIFFGNCTTLGIPCVTATREDAQMLARLVEATPELPVVVDVERSRVFYGLDGAKNFPVHLPDGAREVLLNGKWDPIADLLEGEAATAATASALAYLSR